MGATKEQILFAVAGAVLVPLGWWIASDRYERVRISSSRPLEATALPLPPEVHLDPIEAPEARRETSLFAAPRELLPLDPLVLPEPPLPAVSVRRPSCLPAPVGAAAASLRLPGEALGLLALSEEERVALEAPASPRLMASGDDVVALDTGRPKNGRPADDDRDAPVPAGLTTDELEARFDWVARADATRRMYGSILNADPLRLKARPAEDLRFQQVSEKSGRPVGAPFTIARAEVAGFGLARTFANRALEESAALGTGPGAAAPRRALALRLLEAHPTEPGALPLALAEAERAVAASPADVASLRLLAAVRHAAGDLDGELAVYQDAVAAGSVDPALLARYALFVRGLGCPERAAELVAEARVAGRGSAEVAHAEGLLAADRGDHEAAVAAFRQAGDLSFAGPLEDRERRDVRLASACSLVALGRFDQGAEEARRVLADSPGDHEALLVLGAAQSAAGEAEAARATFDEALARRPADGVLLANAGIAAWQDGDPAAALRLFASGRQADPLRATHATVALGFLHEDLDEPELARELYAEALLAEPGHPEALYRLGRNQRLEGEIDEAAETLREALALSGPEPLLLEELARAELERGRLAEASRYLREALRLAPDHPEIEWSAGLVALRAGDLVSAADALGRAVEHGAAGAHAGLGVAAYRRGEEEAALDHFDELAKAFAGQAEHPQALYAAAQAADIRDNLSKRQWLDRFARSTGQLQRGWTEHQWDGSPRLVLLPGEVSVQGRVERPRTDERPGISRTLDGRGFFGVEAQVVLRGGGDARAGIALTHLQVKGAQGRLPKARLQLFVDGSGAVRSSVLENFDTVVRDALPVEGLLVGPGETVRLGLERVDAREGRFVFTLGGRPAGAPFELKSLRDFRNEFVLELWAEAAPGREVDAGFGMCRIVQAP